MSWISKLRKFRGRETGRAGLFRRICRNWIYQKFKDNEEKRISFFEKYHDGQLTINEFKQLLSDASQYIPKEERDNFLKHFTTGELTEDELDYVLKYAIPDMFYLDEMVIGVGGDPRLRMDYSRAMTMLMNERKTTKEVLKYFWNSPQYQEHKDNGYTEDELWQVFMDAAKSYQVYPLYCDIQGDGKYKLLDMKGYMYILEKRIRSIASEVTKKAKEFIAIGEMFPKIKDQLPTIDGEIAELRPFDTLVGLQPPKHACPLCERTFPDEEMYKRHLIYEHKAKTKQKKET